MILRSSSNGGIQSSSGRVLKRCSDPTRPPCYHPVPERRPMSNASSSRICATPSSLRLDGQAIGRALRKISKASRVVTLSFDDIRAKGEVIFPWASHPHFGRNMNYPIRVPLTDGLTGRRIELYTWLNEHTTQPWSVDHIARNDGTNRMAWWASFQNATDMMLFKLTWCGDID